MSEDVVRYEQADSVAVVTLDDGKANSLSPTSIDALNRALDRAEKEARSMLLSGRPGRLCAGFDLGIMRQGPDAMRGLVMQGAELLLRIYAGPVPVVIACTGHALAAGALLLLSADRRIGCRGDFKIGLNEVAIGMPLPIFGVELARDRLSKRHALNAVAHAQIQDPESAVDAGFLDRLTDPDQLAQEALAEAQALAALSPEAYQRTKASLRGAVEQHIRATLAEDIAQLTGPKG